MAMALTPMAPGGRWLRPPHDGPAVYVPAAQLGDKGKLDSHWKRLIGDGWEPIEDPRKDDGTLPVQKQTPEQPLSARETALQAQIDQLTALVQQLITGKQEQSDGSPIDHEPADQQSTADDRRSGKRKPAV